MILKISFLLCMISLGALGETTSDTPSVIKLLSALNPVNFLDGPPSISHAETTPTTNLRPTLDQMKYYNNYAAAMYCQYQLNDLSCDPCQQFKDDVFDSTVIMNNDTDTTALVTVSKSRQEIVAAFRGTMNIWNVVLDLDAFEVTYPNMGGVKIHAGFHRAAQSLYTQVINNVGYLRSKFPDYKIVFTGHSMGAATARLFQFYVLANKQFPGATYECYTFGEPRSGNQAFANFMNAQTITTARVVNNADIVPHVAPTSVLDTKILGGNYVHCQPEYWYIDEDNQRFCETAQREDPICSDSLGPDYKIDDHGSYLGLSYLPCTIGQPAPWAAIPFSILQPVGKIPPFPQPVADFITGAANFAIDVQKLVFKPIDLIFNPINLLLHDVDNIFTRKVT